MKSIEIGNMDKYYKTNEKINGYLILKIIGIGRYGIVYLAKNDKNEKFVLTQEGSWNLQSI